MQLSARILTALAVLAFTVAVVAGRGATDEVSAATGTIDAMNVGACTTTNADVLKIADCKIGVDGSAGDGNTKAFFEAEALSAAIEVDELYATYAHDPKTAAEAPRGIVANGDLIKISIKDTGRDRRDPVLIGIDGATDYSAADTGVRSDVDEDGGTTADKNVFKAMGSDHVLNDDYDAAEAGSDGGSLKVVADALGVKEEDTAEWKELMGLPLQMPHFGVATATTYQTSGSYTINFTGHDADNPYRPIAPKGVVKFFGSLADESDGTKSKFMDLGGNVKLDEDVISGEPNVPPAMVLNVSVPSGKDVVLEVIYYETSDQESLMGGETYCSGSDGVGKDGDCPAGATPSNEPMNVVYTSDEKNRNTALLVQATADGNDTDAHLYLMETGRFDGIYEGFLRLTDADGNGGGGDDGNWGQMVGDAENAMVDGAAVLGVGNGPVVINYRDSDGRSRSFEIQIDIDPPTINVDSPVHKSRSDDEKPSFIGTINDGDAGLAADTFQLYVDNNPTDAGDDYMVLMGLDADYVVDGTDGIDRRLEYKGYGDTAKYGVVMPGSWMAADSNNDPGKKKYRSVEADAYSNGAPDGEFADEIEIDFDEQANFSFEDGGFNHGIDFQALVRDLAGNVGFSDSDPVKPRFINNLGAEADDRGDAPNVLGVFSKHVVYLDEVDPYIHADRTVTGFYGLNDKKPVRDRSAVMVVFDNDVNGSLIDAGTFMLEDGDGNGIAIADVLVEGQLVFLKLDEELASDATPMLSIAEGREVEDLAGNILGDKEHILKANGDRTTSVKVKDGIQPVFTLTLSGGSGTGAGSEGPTKLTKEAMDIAIESDEDINGAPRVSVICSNIGWTEQDADGNDVSRDLDDFVSARTGYTDMRDAPEGAMCGGAAMPTEFIASWSLSRPGNNWVYAWRNSPSDASSHLPDGGITVVVWGRDRSSFDYYDGSVERMNYGSETAAFTLDNTFNSPLNSDDSGGEVQPDPNSDVAEPRPFVMLDFAGERTNVSVTKLTVDGDDVLASLDSIGENRFLYWPEALEYGEHTVEFDARDAADNKPSGGTKFTFNVTQRDPFVLDISAGWNAVSFPANPVDTALDAVFTDSAIDRVVGWNPMSETGPWSIASRVDGVWTTSENFAPLTDIVVRYGYWVHSMGFIKQSVDLEGPINRETGGKPNPIGIQTVPGWNFIGVVDQDGDQTEDDYGKDLRRKDPQAKDPAGDVVTAEDYMPGFKRAYTWDAIANGYRILEDGDAVKIGKGIWVFFPDGTTVAP